MEKFITTEKAAPWGGEDEGRDRIRHSGIVTTYSLKDEYGKS
jgi:hypothetical protein